ncbi:MAG: RICIN domain-containing protein [Bacteroidota bacterium]
MNTNFNRFLAVLFLFAMGSSMTIAQVSERMESRGLTPGSRTSAKDPLDGRIFRIKAVSQKANGRCLDADAGSLGKNGTKVQLWDCHRGGGPTQDWKFEKVKDNTYVIKSQVAPTKVVALDADGYTYNKNGGKVQLWTTHGGPNQQWTVKQNANGTYRISSAAPQAGGRSLDADSRNLMNGTKIQLWSPNGNPVQQWALIESKNGRPVKSITNVAKGKKATQSTTAYNSPASIAVNGNTSGRYSRSSSNDITHTKDANGSWWQVDLGAIYDIDKIVVWNRTDCCWERLQNFYVTAWAFPIQGNLKQGFGTSGPHDFTSGSNPSMNIGGEFIGRYIRIHLDNGTMPLSLGEVQVFGVPIK